MKLTVLLDNNTLIDRYFFAEPGLSLLIEDPNSDRGSKRATRVLFDTGYSDLFIRNAVKMGKDLSELYGFKLKDRPVTSGEHSGGRCRPVSYL